MQKSTINSTRVVNIRVRSVYRISKVAVERREVHAATIHIVQLRTNGLSVKFSEHVLRRKRRQSGEDGVRRQH